MLSGAADSHPWQRWIAIWGLLVVGLLQSCAAAAPAGPSATATQPASHAVEAFEADPIAGRSLAFRRLTLDDGLSQSTIACIVQDAQGFMWFGTQDGLNRFNGYTFRVYRNDPDDAFSLSNNYVRSCETDQRNTLWVVTQASTLQRYEPETDRFLGFDLGLEDPFRRSGEEFTVLHGDAQGILWIGTYGDGVVRFNPQDNTFVVYRHDPTDPKTLSHRIVTAIYEDRQGAIWVGTENGLNRYDPASDSFVRYPYRDFPPGGYQVDPPVHTYDPAYQPENPDALASPAVTALLEDRAGRLWVGTRYGGLNRLDRETGRFTAYAFDPAYEPADPNTFSGNSVRALLEDYLGNIWVSSAHWNVDETRTYARLGLERLFPETGAIARYRGDPDDPCSLPHDAVQRMVEDSRKNLWIHTFAGGVEIYDRATDCFVHYAHDPGDPQTLSDDGITRFFEDDAAGLWIGTELGGISYYDPTWAKFPHYRVSATGGARMSNNSIWRISEVSQALDAAGHAQALWLSTFAGLDYWDRRTNTFTFYEIDPKLPDTWAFAIYEDLQRGNLWIGTTMGLERAKLPAGSASAPTTLDLTRVLTRTSAEVGCVLDLHPAGADHLWLAEHGVGLSRFDLTTEQVVATYGQNPGDPSSLADDRVTDIFAGRDGALWLITPAGLEQFDPKAEHFTHYLHDPAAPGGIPGRVTTLYQDQAGTLWLGSDGDGLIHLDPITGEVLATYREAQGLPNNVIYSILPDTTGQLWISTNKGLARLDPEAGTFHTYTAQDGLQSNEFNLGADYGAPDGELLFGGINGINAFYPESIEANKHVPPVVITAVTLGPPGSSQEITCAAGLQPDGASALPGAPSCLHGPIALTYRDRILSFEFAALHYAVPTRNQYAYMLEGFDRDWYYVGTQRFATYTNLPPGRYTFRVKASNSDGVWNEAGASLAVAVTPPFWATGWFRGTLGVILVGAAYAAYRLRVRSVEARSRELEVEVGERTRELAAVNTIAEVVSRSLDLDAILSDALDKTLEVISVEAGGIYLLDEARKALWIVVQRGLDPEVVAAIDDLEVGEGFSGRVAASGEPLVVPDLSEDDRLSRIAVRDAALRSLAVVPLRAKGRILGTLFAVSRDRRAFSSANVDLLVAIGHQIGVAVENAGLYTDTRSRLAQLSALQRTATAVASTLDQQRLLGLIVQQATELLGARGGILNLIDWEAGEDRVVAATGSATSALGMGSRLDASLSGWSALHRAPVLSNDLPADRRVDRAGLSLLEVDEGSPVESAAVVPLIVKDRVVGTLVLVDKQTGHRQFGQGDLDLLATFANHAATAIENARLFEAEQRRAEQFRVMSEVGSRIASILDVDELLQQIVSLIHQAFGYYHVAIGLVEGDEVAYRVGAGQLWRDPQFGFVPARLKVGKEGLAGWVAATGEPLLVPDVSVEPRYVWMQKSETRSEVTVPLKAKGDVIGVLDIQSDRLNAFDDSDLLVLQSLAYQAGVAIDNARLYEQAQRLAVVEERQRLARELHDSVTQALYGVTLYAEASARQLALGQADVAADHLNELRETAQEALREMRLLIFELRPAVLVSEGLVGALRARLEAVEERAGLGVSLNVEGEGSLVVRPLPREVEEGLYWIAREALTNALKHAVARNVTVRLSFGVGSVVLEVVDDGVGFDAGVAAQSGGLGVDGMMERAARMGGELALNSEPGLGTTVRVEVPR